MRGNEYSPKKIFHDDILSNISALKKYISPSYKTH